MPRTVFEVLLPLPNTPGAAVIVEEAGPQGWRERHYGPAKGGILRARWPRGVAGRIMTIPYGREQPDRITAFRVGERGELLLTG